MIISTNLNTKTAEFEELLKIACSKINDFANLNPLEVSKLHAQKLENKLHNVLCEEAKNTEFEGTIKLISGLKFPDIIANDYFGVEVKSSKGNNWTSIGNSILEGTRLDGIEKIYLFFGKLSEPVGFKVKPYEECLSDVVVTHSPRYKIDMNLNEGQTIFDKLDVSYDSLRNQEHPVKTISSYYKGNLKEGEQVWWIDNDEKYSQLVVTSWKELPKNQKNLLMCQGMVLFPEIFSNNNDKFTRFALWLMTEKSVVHPNVRDTFSAGGKKSITANNNEYSKIPNIIYRLYSNRKLVKKIIRNTPEEELIQYWPMNYITKDKIDLWKEFVVKSLNTLDEMNPDTAIDLIKDIMITP